MNPLSEIFNELQSKKKANPQTSYTASLYEAGKEKINRKIMEEAFELTQAKNKKEITHEFCDLLYHGFVLLNERKITFKTIEEEMLKRTQQSGWAEKKSRKKNGS